MGRTTGSSLETRPLSGPGTLTRFGQENKSSLTLCSAPQMPIKCVRCVPVYHSASFSSFPHVSLHKFKQCPQTLQPPPKRSSHRNAALLGVEHALPLTHQLSEGTTSRKSISRGKGSKTSPVRLGYQLLKSTIGAALLSLESMWMLIAPCVRRFKKERQRDPDVNSETAKQREPTPRKQYHSYKDQLPVLLPIFEATPVPSPQQIRALVIQFGEPDDKGILTWYVGVTGQCVA